MSIRGHGRSKIHFWNNCLVWFVVWYRYWTLLILKWSWSYSLEFFFMARMDFYGNKQRSLSASQRSYIPNKIRNRFSQQKNLRILKWRPFAPKTYWPPRSYDSTPCDFFPLELCESFHSEISFLKSLLTLINSANLLLA